jgi:hypothetical protein
VVVAFVVLRPRTALGTLRRRAPEWVMGLMGVVLVVTLYPGVGIVADQYFLVPELALLQVLSLGFMFEIGRTSWRWAFGPVLVATLAATVVDWQLYWRGAL